MLTLKRSLRWFESVRCKTETKSETKLQLYELPHFNALFFYKCPFIGIFLWIQRLIWFSVDYLLSLLLLEYYCNVCPPSNSHFYKCLFLLSFVTTYALRLYFISFHFKSSDTQSYRFFYVSLTTVGWCKICHLTL